MMQMYQVTARIHDGQRICCQKTVYDQLGLSDSDVAYAREEIRRELILFAIDHELQIGPIWSEKLGPE